VLQGADVALSGAGTIPAPAPPVGGTPQAAPPHLLAILLTDALTARRGRNVATSVFSTLAGRATVRIMRGRRQVATKAFSAREGKTAVTLPTRKLRAGRYTISRRSRAPARRRATPAV